MLTSSSTAGIVSVAKTDATHFDGGVAPVWRINPLIGIFARLMDDVGHPLQMDAQQAELHQPVNQRGQAHGELLAIGHERQQHAQR